MATKSFSGQLDRPLNTDPAGGDKIFFYPLNTVGEIIESAASIMEIDSSGNYSITLGYNNYSLYYYSDVSKKKTFITTVTVSADTTVSTLPDLIGSTTPITNEVELAVQGYLSDAEQARDDAQTAATEAEAAQAATEALFDTGFDSNVATSVGLAATPYPDLHIPFNDGLRIESGYGTNDIITVDSTDYELPTISVDFTRSSESNVINKSGVLTDLEADEVGITSEGAWLHQSYSNKATYSNSLHNKTPTGATISEVTDDSPFGTTCSEFIEDSTASTGHYLNITTFTPSSSEVNFSFYIKPNVNAGDRNFRMRLANGNVTSISFVVDSAGDITATSGGTTEFISDGWYRVSGAFSGLNLSSTLFRFEVLDGSSITYDGDGESSFYITGAQVSETYNVMPLLVTVSSEESTTSTTATVPIENNLPVPGGDFSFSIDTKFYSGYGGRAMSIDTDQLSFRVDYGSVQLVVKESNADNVLVLQYTSDELGVKKRYVVTKDDLTWSIYENSELKASSDATGEIYYDVNSDIHIGSRLGTSGFLNSSIENIKFYHSALTADQVKALGAAE